MGSNPQKTMMPAPTEALPGREQPLPVAERLFWELPGVWSTSVGHAGGFTPNQTYQEVCTGKTGHTKAFWESHDPMQGMRQGAVAVRSRPKCCLLRNSSTPMIITSSIWRRIPTVTAESAGRASPVPTRPPPPQKRDPEEAQVPPGSAPGSGSGKG